MYIFCIPAGGTNPFMTWTKKMNSDKKIAVLDLPGRGRKFREAPIDNISLLADTLIKDMEKINTDADDYAIFGYCSGALVAYEICRKLQADGKKLPVHFFTFGIGAPDSKNLISKSHDRTTSPEFKMMVSQFFNIGSLGSVEEAERAVNTYISCYSEKGESSGIQMEDIFSDVTEEERFEKQQLVSLLNNSMKQIEQDEQMIKNYQSSERDYPIISSQVDVIYATEDTFVDRELILNWKNFFENNNIIETPGDHYSIMEHSDKFIQILNEL